MKKIVAHIINLFKTSKAFSIIFACSTALVVTVSVGAAVLISEEKQPTDAPSLSTIEISSDTATETVAETTESTTKAVETTTKYVPKETTTKKAETTTKAVVTTVSSSTTEGRITLSSEQLENHKYCDYCGKPNGDGTNGTCIKSIKGRECEHCGEYISPCDFTGNTCHTCND